MNIIAAEKFRIMALAMVAALLLMARVRWRRTRAWDADYPARGDTMRLLAIVLCGQVGELIRTRFKPGTGGFWILSVILLPFVGGALFYLLRLFHAYRSSRQDG